MYLNFHLVRWWKTACYMLCILIYSMMKTWVWSYCFENTALPVKKKTEMRQYFNVLTASVVKNIAGYLLHLGFLYFDLFLYYFFLISYKKCCCKCWFSCDRSTFLIYLIKCVLNIRILMFQWWKMIPQTLIMSICLSRTHFQLLFHF